MQEIKLSSTEIGGPILLRNELLMNLTILRWWRPILEVWRLLIPLIQLIQNTKKMCLPLFSVLQIYFQTERLVLVKDSRIKRLSSEIAILILQRASSECKVVSILIWPWVSQLSSSIGPITCKTTMGTLGKLKQRTRFAIIIARKPKNWLKLCKFSTYLVHS